MTQTKSIGLLGGTSWPSTMLYYRYLNEQYQAQQGGHHSCPILLHSIDYHEIKSRYHHGWDEIPQLVQTELQRLINLEPSCIVLCNNTLHKALDIVRDDLVIDIPVVHIVHETARHITAADMHRVLLLGTQWTMEHGHFAGILEQYGIEVVIPELSERIEIQRIQSLLARGVMEDEFMHYFAKLAERYEYCDGLILGCTELPLAFEQIETPMPQIDTIHIQCEAALRHII